MDRRSRSNREGRNKVAEQESIQDQIAHLEKTVLGVLYVQRDLLELVKRNAERSLELAGDSVERVVKFVEKTEMCMIEKFVELHKAQASRIKYLESEVTRIGEIVGRRSRHGAP